MALWWEAVGRGTEVKKEDDPYSHSHSLFCAAIEAPNLPRVLQLPHLNQSVGYSHTRNEACGLRACPVQECCSPFASQIQYRYTYLHCTLTAIEMLRSHLTCPFLPHPSSYSAVFLEHSPHFLARKFHWHSVT